MTTFYELGLSFPVTRAISDMGFEEATPIQAETIPKALQGLDIIGRAQTGTGKTAAFGVPLTEKIEHELYKLQGLVITPTRELAIQVAEELNKIGQFKHIRSLPIYGGQQIDRQIKALKKRPQIIVGTPGRLMDHMRRRTIRLDDVQFVVLDEADEMLNMGFIEDIEAILAEIPEERQTLLFSATMPGSIQKLAEKFMKNPEVVSIKAKEMTVPNIEQHAVEVREREKFDVLCRLLDIQLPDLAIVFGRTKRRVDELYEALKRRGYSVEGIHGDLSQTKRTSVLRQFRAGDIEVLVATDVAARGLDISGVTHVYNFDIPQDPESYVHRVGRTGRAGKTGLATTFVTPREIELLRKIEQVSKRKMIRKPIPTLSEAFEGQQRIAMEKLLHVVEEGDTAPYKQLAKELLADYDSVALLSSALKMLTKEPDTSPVHLTEEKPLWTKSFNRSNNHKKSGRQGGFHKKRGNRSGSRKHGWGDSPESRKRKGKRGR